VPAQYNKQPTAWGSRRGSAWSQVEETLARCGCLVRTSVIINIGTATDYPSVGTKTLGSPIISWA
jgi:ABC-type proline/glycine betaine transport system permease subunit